jgi:hypothetical protein
MCFSCVFFFACLVTIVPSHVSSLPDLHLVLHSGGTVKTDTYGGTVGSAQSKWAICGNRHDESYWQERGYLKSISSRITENQPLQKATLLIILSGRGYRFVFRLNMETYHSSNHLSWLLSFDLSRLLQYCWPVTARGMKI